MFPLHNRLLRPASFEIDSPKFSITSDVRELAASLKRAGIEYSLPTEGYIVFAGKILDSDIPLMIGIHFNSEKVKFIEIFRPQEYYQAEGYDINASYSELSKLLRSKYGTPVTTASNGNPHEMWTTCNYIVNHYIIDRFGAEEHLHINFHKER